MNRCSRRRGATCFAWSLAIIVIAGCGAASSDPAAPPRVEPDAGTPSEASAPCIAPRAAPEWLDAFLADHMARLTGEIEAAPGMKLTDRGTPANRRATRTYLAGALRSLGYSPTEHDYGEGANVVAPLAATTDAPSEWVVVGAHFDGATGSPGANDNATGVAVVLAVARAVASLPCRSRGVMFVFFDQEEEGLKGSNAFATREVQSGTRIVAAHTIDQVGWDDDDDRTFEIERPTPALLAEYQAGAAAVDARAVETKTSGTDHQAFRTRGFAAVGVTEEYVNGDTSPHRHLAGDTRPTVKASYQALAARLVTYVIARELGAE